MKSVTDPQGEQATGPVRIQSCPSRARRPRGRRGRRWIAAGCAGLTFTLLATLAASVSMAAPSSAATTASNRASAIVAIAREALKADHLKAIILRVTVNGKPVTVKENTASKWMSR